MTTVLSNIFHLRGLTELTWRVYAPHRPKEPQQVHAGGSSSFATDWKALVAAFDALREEAVLCSLSSSSELWVFGPNAVSDNILQRTYPTLSDVASGVWRVRATELSSESEEKMAAASRQLFLALHIRLESTLSQHLFTKVGSTFVCPAYIQLGFPSTEPNYLYTASSTSPASSSSTTNVSAADPTFPSAFDKIRPLSCSFVFFVSEGVLCFHVFVQKHKNWKTITRRHNLLMQRTKISSATNSRIHDPYSFYLPQRNYHFDLLQGQTLTPCILHSPPSCVLRTSATGSFIPLHWVRPLRPFSTSSLTSSRSSCSSSAALDTAIRQLLDLQPHHPQHRLYRRATTRTSTRSRKDKETEKEGVQLSSKQKKPKPTGNDPLPWKLLRKHIAASLALGSASGAGGSGGSGTSSRSPFPSPMIPSPSPHTFVSNSPAQPSPSSPYFTNAASSPSPAPSPATFVAAASPIQVQDSSPTAGEQQQQQNSLQENHSSSLKRKFNEEGSSSLDAAASESSPTVTAEGTTNLTSALEERPTKRLREDETPKAQNQTTNNTASVVDDIFGSDGLGLDEDDLLDSSITEDINFDGFLQTLSSEKKKKEEAKRQKEEQGVDLSGASPGHIDLSESGPASSPFITNHSNLKLEPDDAISGYSSSSLASSSTSTTTASTVSSRSMGIHSPIAAAMDQQEATQLEGDVGAMSMPISSLSSSSSSSSFSSSTSLSSSSALTHSDFANTMVMSGEGGGDHNYNAVDELWESLTYLPQRSQQQQLLPYSSYAFSSSVTSSSSQFPSFYPNFFSYSSSSTAPSNAASSSYLHVCPPLYKPLPQTTSTLDLASVLRTCPPTQPQLQLHGAFSIFPSYTYSSSSSTTWPGAAKSAEAAGWPTAKQQLIPFVNKPPIAPPTFYSAKPRPWHHFFPLSSQPSSSPLLASTSSSTSSLMPSPLLSSVQRHSSVTTPADMHLHLLPPPPHNSPVPSSFSSSSLVPFKMERLAYNPKVASLTLSTTIPSTSPFLTPSSSSSSSSSSVPSPTVSLPPPSIPTQASPTSYQFSLSERTAPPPSSSSLSSVPPSYDELQLVQQNCWALCSLSPPIIKPHTAPPFWSNKLQRHHTVSSLHKYDVLSDAAYEEEEEDALTDEEDDSDELEETSAASIVHTLFALRPLLSQTFSEWAAAVNGPLTLEQWQAQAPIESRLSPTPSGCSYLGLVRLDVPMVQVGYKGEWLRVPPATAMRWWEKGQLEPYAPRKDVIYYVLCPQPSSPAGALTVIDFFRELSCIYETCNLGRHQPPNIAATAFPNVSAHGMCWVPCDLGAASVYLSSRINSNDVGRSRRRRKTSSPRGYSSSSSEEGLVSDSDSSSDSSEDEEEDEEDEEADEDSETKVKQEAKVKQDDVPLSDVVSSETKARASGEQETAVHSLLLPSSVNVAGEGALKTYADFCDRLGNHIADSAADMTFSSPQPVGRTSGSSISGSAVQSATSTSASGNLSGASSSSSSTSSSDATGVPIASLMNTCIVVYAVNPFCSDAALSAFFTRALSGILKCTQNLPHAPVVVQEVSMEEIISCTQAKAATASRASALASMKELAFAVFNKCRRPSVPRPLNFADMDKERLYEPLLVLPPPPPQQETVGTDQFLHVAYVSCEDRKRCAVAITDHRGELLSTRIFSCVSGEDDDATFRLFTDIWIYCLAFLRALALPTSTGWSIVIATLGTLSAEDMYSWQSVLHRWQNQQPATSDCSQASFLSEQDKETRIAESMVLAVSLLGLTTNSALQLAVCNNFSCPEEGEQADQQQGVPSFQSLLQAARKQMMTGSGESAQQPSYFLCPPAAILTSSDFCGLPGGSSSATTAQAPVQALASACILSPPINGPHGSYFQARSRETNSCIWPDVLTLSLLWQHTHPTSSGPALQNCPAYYHMWTKRIASHFHDLSWLNITPQWPQRQCPLPFHLSVAARMLDRLSAFPC